MLVNGGSRLTATVAESPAAYVKTDPSERAYWVAWSQIEGIGPVLQKRLYSAFGSLAAAWGAGADQLLGVDGIGLLLADQVVRLRSHLSPAQILAQFEAGSASFWTPADPEYPTLLFEIPDPPPVLYYRGPLRLNRLQPQPLTVGIVGTRHPSDYGRRWTERLTCQLAQQGALVISGMARGVDAIAHKSCVAQTAPTLAVLGTGVDIAYPASNQGLYQDIATTGLLLSEYADGTPPDRTHFPRRNRIIAGLSQAIIVTEAPARSGALITAHLANDYGREVYALPGSLDNPRSQGCLNLIEQGCQPIVSEAKLLTALGGLPVPDRSPLADASATHASSLPLPTDLAPELNQLLQTLSDEAIGLDTLAQQTNQDTSRLLSNLMQLELQGLIVQLPGMQYRRA